MRKYKILTLGWFLALGCGSLLVLGTFMAPPDVNAGPRANPKRGKVFYKKNCRACHDGQTAGAKELSPITKTMQQWQREFAKEGEVVRCLPRVQEKLGAELTDRDLLDISAYLIQHAADSDQPATCGN